MKLIVSAAHIAIQAYGSQPLGPSARAPAGGQVQAGGQAGGQAGHVASDDRAQAVTVEISQAALKAAGGLPVRGGVSSARPLFSKAAQDDEVTAVFEPLVLLEEGEGGRGRREAPLAGARRDRDAPADQRPGRLVDIRV